MALEWKIIFTPCPFRFTFIRETLSIKRKGGKVKIVHEINLDPHRKDIQAQPTGKKFRLIRVAIHKGASCNSGHYFAGVREQQSTWIIYDDAQVIKKKL